VTRAGVARQLRLSGTEPHAAVWLFARDEALELVPERLRPCGRALGELVACAVADAAGEARWSLGARPELDDLTLTALVLPRDEALSSASVSNSVSLPPQSGTGGLGNQTGAVVVTEFLKDPSAVTDGHGEWIELWNSTRDPIDIEGWTLADEGSDEIVLDNGGLGLVIEPFQFFVLGRDADPATNGGVAVDYEYSGFSMTNSADEIALYMPSGTLVDLIRYDNGVEWPDDSGKAISLDRRYFRDGFANDDGAGWCSAFTLIDANVGTDTGTPGAPNDDCD